MTRCEGNQTCTNEAIGAVTSSKPIRTPWAPLSLNLCEACFAEYEQYPRRVEPMGCVGIWGRHRETTADSDLGRGGRVGVGPDAKGLRRAAWDAAFGYVSGFRKRDIAYWVLTRSLSQRVYRRVAALEGRDIGHGA